MVQGTASNAGKSVLVTGLCRFFSNLGLKVCPFKAQNITTASYAVSENEEIGYAQYIQALACRMLPDSRINPVMIKINDESVDFILNGTLKLRGSFDDYSALLPQMKSAIIESYESLRQEYDFIIVEGVGSPVEINRKSDDIANMWLANYFQIPVVLVSNMEYGGSFASVVGTLELLEPRYRDLVKGFFFNKYNGNQDLLTQGIQFIENKYGIIFGGAMPYVENLHIPEEDKLIYRDQINSYQLVEKSELFQSFDRLAGVMKEHLMLDFNFLIN